MPFTTVAFIETTQNNGLAPVAPAADQHLTISGDDVTIPEFNYLLAALAWSANANNAQIRSPKLRELYHVDLADFIKDATLPTNQAVDEGGAATFEITQGLQYNDYTKDPIFLEISEKLNLYVDNANNNEATYGIVFLSDGELEPVKGEIRTIRATGSTTVTAGAWSNCPLTFSQDLPAGRYGIVGMRAMTATPVAARAVIPGVWHRPGCIPSVLPSDPRPKIFRNGNLGVWAEFEFDSPPSVDMLCVAGDTAQEIFFDLIQLRKGRAGT